MNATPDDLDNEGDEDLLAMMSWDDEPRTCSAACAAFYRRHVQFVYARCCKAFLGKGMNRHDVEELVAETFLRVKEHAASFQPASSGDAAQRRHRVLAWVFKIAQHLAIDVFRGRKSAPKMLADPDRWESFPQCANVAPSERTLLVQRAVEEILDAREREILLVTMHYYDPAKAHQRLPDDVVADLAKRYSTTSENMRKIRMRALAKIREYIEAALPNSMTAS